LRQRPKLGVSPLRLVGEIEKVNARDEEKIIHQQRADMQHSRRKWHGTSDDCKGRIAGEAGVKLGRITPEPDSDVRCERHCCVGAAVQQGVPAWVSSKFGGIEGCAGVPEEAGVCAGVWAWADGQVYRRERPAGLDGRRVTADRERGGDVSPPMRVSHRNVE